MPWLISILTGLVGMFVSGFVAAMAVDWYNIPGREGESGYFVVFLAILGFGAGAIIGLIVARRVAAGSHPHFMRALGVSLGVVAGIGVLSAGLARVLADVPPELDGETLLLAVEVRWPIGRQEGPTAIGQDEASLGLHSIPAFSHTVRASESGPLWMGDAHLVDGRWVVPGAVEIFTSRGSRMLTVNTGDSNSQGFAVPLRAFPNRRDLEWSEWLPQFRPGVEVPPDLLSYRFRVQKVSQPVRSETVGPFEIATTASAFYQVQQDDRTLFAASATFGFQYRGQPLTIEARTSSSGESTERFDPIDDVALLGGTPHAFLIHVDAHTSSGYYYLVAEGGERARIEYVAEGSSGMKGQVLTSDPVLFHAAGNGKTVPGRIDRISYETPGFYRLGRSVIDTRRLVVHPFTPDSAVYDIPAVPPLGLSPDERSFVTYATGIGSEPPPLVVVTDFMADKTYTLPIDPVRMRYAKFESLDPAWLDHHFEWQRGRDGVDRLIERRHFVPLPYRGELSVESDGNRTYRLEKGSEALRGALLDFLVQDFKADRQPADSGVYEVPVTIAGHKVNVAFSGDFGYVSVSLDRGSAEDTTLVPRIGAQFDALLATGRYDDLFGK